MLERVLSTPEQVHLDRIGNLLYSIDGSIGSLEAMLHDKVFPVLFFFLAVHCILLFLILVKMRLSE